MIEPLAATLERSTHVKSKDFLRILQAVRALPPEKKQQLRDYLIELRESGDTSARPVSSLPEGER